MDFGALAARLAANIEDVRACLLMSRDGLTLGVHPREEESMVRDVWDRLRSIGNPDRGFLVVGDELWIVARRGPYAGIAVASASATPGLLLDRLEFTLRAAEELRLRDGSAPPSSRSEAARRPRMPLHPEPASEPAPQALEGRAEPGAPEEDLAWVAEPVELLPMVDLSAVNGGRKTEPAPMTPPTGDDGSLDPVRAAIQFASMTGAVGAIPTMPRSESPAPTPPGQTPEGHEQVPADVEAEAPPAPTSSVPPDVEAEAPPAPTSSVPPDVEAEAPPAPVATSPPDVEERRRRKTEDRKVRKTEDRSRRNEVIADEPPRPPAEPPPPEPSTPEPPSPAAEVKPSRRPRLKEEEAEVDPVDLAREFAQLGIDFDEEAR